MFPFENKEELLCSALFISLLAFPNVAYGKASSGDELLIDTAMPASIPTEIIADWKKKDNVAGEYSAIIEEIKSGLPAQWAFKIDTGSTEAQYLKACHWRRVARLRPFSRELKKLLCGRHYNEGGASTGYLEDMNDDVVMLDGVRKTTVSKGSRYTAGAALLVIDFDDYYPSAKTLLEDKTGVLRDPCVSFDAKKVAFAWSKDNNGYHVFEMDVENPDSIRQLTFDLPDLTVSDYEPCYLPNGDIVFNSSRCFQDDGFLNNVVSNLYIMNKDGKHMRRICYDQAQNFHPTVMSNGKIMFSRWEFNDRHPGYAFGVFIMNPDGTGQNEHFGNQLTYPNTFPNAREIPGSGGKFLSIVGHIMWPVYQGDLVIVNPAKGRNAIEAVQLIAPKRDIYSDPIKNFQDPYPLNETWFLISYTDNPSTTAKYRLYLMDVDGNRELLAWDANQSISQPIPLCEKKAPALACQADYSKTTAEVTMANAYYGMALDSTIKPGTIKKIRVIALEYRMYPAMGGFAGAFTPVARLEASHEAKRIIGEMKVESDGSAAFIVPAQTPLYVQLIDTSGCMIQSMRSWMTLLPGEKFDCFGCHEDKNVSPPPVGTRIARTPKALEPFYDIADGYFHYSAVIQPIFDALCVSCHVDGHESGLDLSGEIIWTNDYAKGGNLRAERFWCKSYFNLTDPARKLVSYISANSFAEGLKPDSVGSKHSKLITKLRERSGAMINVGLFEDEMAKLCAWIDLSVPHGGKYTDDMKPEHAEFYENRLLLRKQEEAFEAQNIAEFVKNGGYNAKEYGGTFFSASVNQGAMPHNRGVNDGWNFQVRFFHGCRKLVMQLPSAGNVEIIDLKGRRIFQINARGVRGRLQCTPANGFPSGLYIVKFRGKSGSAERVVPVM